MNKYTENEKSIVIARYGNGESVADLVRKSLEVPYMHGSKRLPLESPIRKLYLLKTTVCWKTRSYGYKAL